MPPAVVAASTALAVLGLRATLRGLLDTGPSLRTRRRLASLRVAGAPGRRLVEACPPVHRWLEGALHDAGLALAPTPAVGVVAGALALAAGAGMIVGGPAVAGVAGGAVVLAAIVGLIAARGRRSRLADAALPGFLDAIARSLRAGASLARAVESAAAASPAVLSTDLAPLTGALTGGVGLLPAVDAWRSVGATAPRTLTAAALSLAAETGGAPAGVVDAVAATLRERSALVREVRALSTQARASAVVMALAPVGFAALSATADPRIGRFLFHSTAGAACLAGGVVLDLLGAAWMGRLVRRRR